MKPIVSLGTAERQWDKVERARLQQASTPATLPDAVTPARATAVPQWTDFRGPGRDGRYEGQILTTWPASGLEQIWRQPVGGGYASVVAGAGKLYTIEQRRGNEVVAAYDQAAGRELWTHSYPAFFQESMGGDGPRATPTYHDGLLYSLGATGEMRCLDAASGMVKWSRNVLIDNQAANIQWGMSNAPLIVDEKAIVTPGGSGTRGMCTGSTMRYWRASIRAPES